MSHDHDESPAVKFASSCSSSFYVKNWTDKRQLNGRWYPAFPAATIKQEEEYIERMIQRDKELGFY